MEVKRGFAGSYSLRITYPITVPKQLYDTFGFRPHPCLPMKETLFVTWPKQNKTIPPPRCYTV